MVGSGFQQADDPQLAVRDAEATLIAVADDADASHLEGRSSRTSRS
jgi:hypothetical protein